MDLWPHQQRGLGELSDKLAGGYRRPCVCAPTGGGKSRMMFEVIRDRGEGVLLLTHRRMLRDQLSQNLAAQGIEHGLIASGMPASPGAPVQLAMVQTLARRRSLSLPTCQTVLVDEWHDLCNGESRGMTDSYADAGAEVIGFTATPLDMNGAPDCLVQAGVNSELRECGALVPANHYGCPEPDITKIKRQKTGEYEVKGLRKAIITQTVFASVLEHFKRLNPGNRPSIGFAPDVAGSLWFAEQFSKAGIPAAHIDAKEIWIEGDVCDSTPENRAMLADMSRTGEVAIVWNRFVLREGIDWTWLEHCVLATAFGGLKSYLQSGGRVLRAHPGLEAVTIQDHGGHWHRLGSLNADRHWSLDDSDRVVTSVREERMRKKKEPEPIVCGKCGACRLSGPLCHTCGHRCTGKSRMVIQTDGKLVEHKGDIYRPRRTYERPNVEQLWESYYYRAKRSRNGMTFNQARALFAMEHNYMYPPDGLKLMPRTEADWFRRVRDVPVAELT